MLLRGGWPQLYAEGGALLDPMCGSGTLLIEGALMAADVAPGLLRAWAARCPRAGSASMRRAGRRWSTRRAQREQAGRAALRPVFFGSDLDPHAIRAARENAERRRAWSMSIELDVARRARDCRRRPQPRGLVVCNPPYDARLAADPALYRALGDALKRAVPDWRASLLCGDAELAYATGLRAEKKYQLFNGAIECTLIVVRSDRAAAARAQRTAAGAVGRRADGRQPPAQEPASKLKSWREREGVTCYRAYDADLPEYAAAIDVYATDAATRDASVPARAGIRRARRRFPKPTRAAASTNCWPPRARCSRVPRERIALKTRARGKGGSKYGQLRRSAASSCVVREGDARLRVNLFDYLDTGLFLDHRPLRLRIARGSRGHALPQPVRLHRRGHRACRGRRRARQTTTVDLSATYLQWCADNLRANGFGGARHRLVQADALQWLEADRGEYDLIFCDPPTFSNSKRAEDFDVQRDHVRLLRAAVARLAPRRRAVFLQQLPPLPPRRRRGGAVRRCVEDISAQTIPPDFARDARIHRCWRLRRRD